MQHALENSTCDPLKCKMGNPMGIESKCMGRFIVNLDEYILFSTDLKVVILLIKCILVLFPS